jgi:general secretion pathway protein A
MYNSFYGLDTDPFRVNPDPRFLYLSESHREALATLVYAANERKGFIVLTGEVGTGKTTILNALLNRLDPSTQAAYIFNTKLTTEDFFAYLFDELELDPVIPFRKSAVLHRLNDYLIERLKNGQKTLLIIDEAQNLESELLEEIRMLSNLETPTSKLLQMVLVGQPELAEKLATTELRQLRQRVELWHEIRALGSRETEEYVAERLMIAGHETGEVFTRAALRAVHQFSKGIPRIINVVCDSSLLTAFVKESRRVSAQMVHEAAHDLGLRLSESRPPAPTERPTPRRGWLRRIWSRRQIQHGYGS